MIHINQKISYEFDPTVGFSFFLLEELMISMSQLWFCPWQDVGELQVEGPQDLAQSVARGKQLSMLVEKEKRMENFERISSWTSLI